MAEVQMTFTDILNADKNTELYVRQISYHEIKPFIFNIHYARRMPPVNYAFGLFLKGELIGIITYGVPPSPSLCKGLAGEDNFYNILELNRLVIKPEYNGKNYASYFIARTLKMLPNHTFIVSFADTGWSHIGYVYQATNWLYTGLTAKRVDVFSDGKHPRHYNKDVEYYQNRTQKHRYIYLVGNKRERKQMMHELRYKIQPYPKGNEIKYDPDDPKPVIAVEKIRKRER